MAVQDMNNRYVAAIKEAAYGTTPSGTYFFGEVDDESIKHSYDLLTREDMSRYGSSKAVTGKEYSEGDINMALINDNFTGFAWSNGYQYSWFSIGWALCTHIYRSRSRYLNEPCRCP